MGQRICPNCGANEFDIVNGYEICRYCDSKFKIEVVENKKEETFISLKSDIECLLEKCKNEPWNARKYANLILDIDPTNSEAKKYLY